MRPGSEEWRQVYNGDASSNAPTGTVRRAELISSTPLGGRATHCLYNIICTSRGEIKATAGDGGAFDHGKPLTAAASAGHASK